MNIINKYNLIGIEPDLYTNTELQLNNFAQEFNCVRVGIIQEFIADKQLVRVKIASQRLVRINPDGTQTTQDYAEIYAKLCYASPFITFPPQIGDECVLLFNDREMESWWINGAANQRAYDRMHDLTDCIAICGLRSQPKLIEILTNVLHLFYGNSNIQIQDSAINYNSTTHAINGATNITGNTTVTGVLTASSAVVQDGATGTFRSQDNKTVIVTNGIITSISE